MRDLVAARRGGWVARGLTGPTSDELRVVCRDGAWRFVELHVGAAGDKLALMRALAEQLDFPVHFGGNWDAVADCLPDVGDGHEGVVVRLKGLGALPPRLAAPLVETLDEQVTGAAFDDTPGGARPVPDGPWVPFVVVADPPLPNRGDA